MGMTVTAKVLKVIDRGAIVLVDDEVEGFVPAAQLGLERFNHPGEHFKTDDELQVTVTRTDLANHRMVLSVKSWLAEQDEETQKAFLDEYSQQRATVVESTDEAEVDVPLDEGEEI